MRRTRLVFHGMSWFPILGVTKQYLSITQKATQSPTCRRVNFFCPLVEGSLPRFSEPKMLQINNSIRELLHKKRGCILSFCGIPRFSCINFIQNKISQCWYGVYVKGSSEVWQWPRFSCIYFIESKIAQCWCRVYVKGSSEVWQLVIES